MFEIGIPKKAKDKIKNSYDKKGSKSTLSMSEKVRSNSEVTLRPVKLSTFSNIQTLGLRNNSRKFIYVEDEDKLYLVIRFNNSYWKLESTKVIQEVL
jgi:hypothetical protein